MKPVAEDLYILAEKAVDGRLNSDRQSAIIEKFVSFGWCTSDGVLTDTGQQFFQKSKEIETALRQGISILNRKRVTTLPHWIGLGGWKHFVWKSPKTDPMKWTERYRWYTTEGFLIVKKPPKLPDEIVHPLPDDEYVQYEELMTRLRQNTFTGYEYEPLVYQRKSLAGPGVIWMFSEAQKPIPIQEIFFDIVMAMYPTARFFTKQFSYRLLTICDRHKQQKRFRGLIGAVAAVNVDSWPIPTMLSNKL